MPHSPYAAMVVPRRLPNELFLIWGMFALVLAAVFVTYSRIPPEQLYHVSRSGIVGGLSRALVWVNFPVAIAALGILVVVYDRLAGRPLRALALVAAALCAVVAGPHVVDQADLDAKWINAVPAVGVAIALALTVVAARHSALPAAGPWRRGDSVRVALALLLIVVALPWLAAELGFYLDGVPILGRVFLTGEIRLAPGQREIEAAVHHGSHHGLDGVLLALTALLLLRTLPTLPRRPQILLRVLASVMLVYGAWNAANDGWFEQVVKRGWTNWRVPDVLTPRANLQWALLLALAAALAFTLELRARARAASSARAHF